MSTARKLSAGTTLVVAAALLNGCGSTSPEPAAENVTITFWDDNAGKARTPVWQQIIAEFEKANPTIKVKYVGVPITDVQKKYDAAIAGGGLPDVGGVTSAVMSNLVIRDALIPVDDYIADSRLNDELDDSVLTSIRSTVPDRKVYMVPMSTNAGVFWYRKDLFASGGLRPPETWPAFYAALTSLTDSGGQRYGYTIRGGAGSIAQVVEFIYGQSGLTDMFDPDGVSTVNNPRNVAALEKLVGLYQRVTPKADVDNDYPKMVAQFDGGSIAVMQHNLGSYNDHVEALGKEKIGAFVLPRSNTGVQIMLSNPVSGLGVFRTGKHRDAAFRFAEFAASKTSNSYWARQTGQLPSNDKVLGESWLKQEAPLMEATRVLSDPATRVVQMPYYLPKFNSITKAETEPLFQQVLRGELSPKAFLDQLAEKLTKAQAEYQQRVAVQTP
jgi:multiple sugar transport system substrate-binding protein